MRQIDNGYLKQVMNLLHHLIDIRERDVSYSRKDFIIINKTYGYILHLVVSVDDAGLFTTMEQLPETKNQLKKWYSNFVSKGWKIISAVYIERCEIVEELQNKWGNPLMEFVFFGSEDFTKKLQQMHKKLGKVGKRFDWLNVLLKQRKSSFF